MTEVPDTAKKDMTFKFVDSVDEMIPLVFDSHPPAKKEDRPRRKPARKSKGTKTSGRKPASKK